MTMMATKWEHVIVVFGGVILLFQGVSSRFQCSNTAITQCIGHFNEEYMRDTSEELFAYYDDQQFAALCEAYEKYEACLEPFKHSCSSTQKAIFEGEEDGFGYACGKGSDVYLRNKECFNKDHVQKDGGQCVRTFQATQSRLLKELDYAYNKADADDIKDRYCQAVDDVLDCIEDILQLHCNDEIAEWQREVDTKMLGPVLDQIGCDEQEVLSTIAIVAIVFAVVITIAVIIGCFCMYRNLAKKRQLRNDASNNYEHEMHLQYPPYHAGPMPVAAGPQPPAYVEKSPPYEPPKQGMAPLSVAPSAPPSYHSATPSEHGNFHDLQSEHSYEDLQRDTSTGYDNPAYTLN